MEMKIEFKKLENSIIALDGDKKMGEITWSNAGDDLMIVDHTGVNEEYRGRKIGNYLLEEVVKLAKKENKKIMPLCPFAKKVFMETPEYQEIMK